jgi:hypothetical protein
MAFLMLTARIPAGRAGSPYEQTLLPHLATNPGTVTAVTVVCEIRIPIPGPANAAITKERG